MSVLEPNACPICGSLVSLGHFNDVIQKSGKLDEHITDLSKDDGKVHIIDTNKNCIAYSLNVLTIPAGLCMLGNRLKMTSDREQHCIPTKILALFLGTVCESGFEDGPVSKARFSGPVGLCAVVVNYCI